MSVDTQPVGSGRQVGVVPITHDGEDDQKTDETPGKWVLHPREVSVDPCERDAHDEHEESEAAEHLKPLVSDCFQRRAAFRRGFPG
ncbi:hypothetical protein GCM10027597_49760 [Saccharopolyspora tripterygii]